MKMVKDKKLVVGADFAGYLLKEAVCEHLRKKGWEITDIGVKADSDPNDTDLMFHRVGLRVGAMGRIHFAHVRNIKILPDGSFEESGHLSKCGSLDVVEILKAYYETGFKGYLRPDHGRMIWGETGKPGYDLYDRALGAMYMAGIWETLDKEGLK